MNHDSVIMLGIDYSCQDKGLGIYTLEAVEVLADGTTKTSMLDINSEVRLLFAKARHLMQEKFTRATHISVSHGATYILEIELLVMGNNQVDERE